MTRETVDAKARRYLAEGRLVVVHVDARGARARCRGSGAVYDLEVSGGEWSCSCPARVQRCAHLLALALVVNVPSVAAEPDLGD